MIPNTLLPLHRDTDGRRVGGPENSLCTSARCEYWAFVCVLSGRLGVQKGYMFPRAVSGGFSNTRFLSILFKRVYKLLHKKQYSCWQGIITHRNVFSLIEK